jgi:hypothetical protein
LQSLSLATSGQGRQGAVLPTVVVVVLDTDDKDDDDDAKAWTCAAPPARSIATRNVTKTTTSPTT